MGVLRTALLLGATAAVSIASPVWPQDSGTRLIPAERFENDPLTLPVGTEFHVVSGRETEIVDGWSIVQVMVDRPGSTVALVLTSRESILWRLEATAGTEVAAVLVDAKERRLPHVESALDLPVRQLDLPVATSPDGEGADELLLALEGTFQTDRLASFNVSVDIPGRVVIDRMSPRTVDEGPPDIRPALPQATEADPSVRFSLVAEGNRLQEWTLTGPLDGNLDIAYPPDTYAWSPDRRLIYRYQNQAIVIRDLDTELTRSVPLPLGLPEIGSVRGLAYDMQRDQVMLVTAPTQSFFYRFDASTEQWIDASPIADRSDSSMMGVWASVDSLVYDPVRDRYVGLGVVTREALLDGKALILISPTGAGRPQTIAGLEWVGLDQIREARDLPNDASGLWLVSHESGYIFLAPRGQAIWWLPRGASVAELTFVRPLDDVSSQ